MPPQTLLMSSQAATCSQTGLQQQLSDQLDHQIKEMDSWTHLPLREGFLEECMHKPR